jgi:hypothetical protein
MSVAEVFPSDYRQEEGSPTLVVIEGGVRPETSEDVPKVVSPGLPGVEIAAAPDARPQLIGGLNTFILNYSMDPGFDDVIDRLAPQGVYIWELTDEEKKLSKADYGLGLHVKKEGGIDAKLLVFPDSEDELEHILADYRGPSGESLHYETSKIDNTQPPPDIIEAISLANDLIAATKAIIRH